MLIYPQGYACGRLRFPNPFNRLIVNTCRDVCYVSLGDLDTGSSGIDGMIPMMIEVIAITQIVILPLTFVTLRALNVPEKLELTAGGLLAGGYGLLAGIVVRLVI